MAGGHAPLMGHATIEWVYVGVVVSLLTYVGAESWNVERLIEHAPEDAKTIKVTGQQWFWTFEHEDGKQEVGELHVTRGVPYKFELVSTDVIHDFNIPDFTILLDVVPGRVNTVWNIFDKSGEYLIQCREYCGLLHYNMKAKLFVEEPTAETAQASSSSAQAASAGGSNETSASAPAPTATAPSAANTTTAAAAATLNIPQGASVQGNPAYDPDPLTVKVGDTIAVNNEDTTPHTVTNGKDATDPNMGKLFDTSIINAGDSGEIVTTGLKPGEYPYFCSVHPYMTGTLTVQ
jgi:cytochrome c oxidase subunit 2